MIIGFTGTREGMSPAQAYTVRNLLTELKGDIVHHGDCVGSDSIFDMIANEYGSTVIVHPPVDDRLRAFCTSSTTRTPKPYLDRNRDIVEESDILIATPLQHQEIKKGGTWYTVRYAREIGKRVLIVWPNGTVTRD
jgi:hypothetical protein